MQFGDRVVLMQPYQDMPAGTPLIFLYQGRASGYPVSVCVRDDALYRAWLAKHKVYSLSEYASTLSEQHAAVFQNFIEHRPLEFSVVKPDRQAVHTLMSLDLAWQAAADEATRLAQIRTAFLSNIGYEPPSESVVRCCNELSKLET